MRILARLTNFLDFHGFRKAVATALLGISKIPMINIEIHSFSFYLFKNFCFLVTQICALGRWGRVKTGKLYTYDNWQQMKTVTTYSIQISFPYRFVSISIS